MANQVAIEGPSETNARISPLRRRVGYKIFSRWIASNDDFFVLRRFDNLNSRVILRLQWQLTQLESKLNEIDTTYSKSTEPSHETVHFARDEEFPDDGRAALLDTIQQKLKEYNDFVLTHSTLKSRKRASDHSLESVQTWLDSHPSAIVEDETSSTTCKEDLIELYSQSKLHYVAISKVSNAFAGYRSSVDIRTSRKKTKVDAFVTIVVCVVGLVMLITPLWILMFVEPPVVQLGVITGFLVLFLVLIQSVTVAKPFEALAATAAYSAVLLVFMQIGGNRN